VASPKEKGCKSSEVGRSCLQRAVKQPLVCAPPLWGWSWRSPPRHLCLYLALGWSDRLRMNLKRRLNRCVPYFRADRKCTRQTKKSRITSAAQEEGLRCNSGYSRGGMHSLSWKTQVTTSNSYIKGLPLVSGIQIQHNAATTNAAPAIENAVPKPCCWAILPTAKGAAALAIRPTL
jgi:hypothetical protein